MSRPVRLHTEMRFLIAESQSFILFAC